MSLIYQKVNKRIFLIVASYIGTIVILLFSVFRIIKINKLYPNPQVSTHELGDRILEGDITLCFQNYQLLSGNEFRKLYPTYNDDILNYDMTPVKDEQRYVLMVTVQIENITDEEKIVSLVQIYAESLAWSNGIDGNLFPIVNEICNDPMRIALCSEETMEIVLPYSLYDFQFQAKSWENIANKKFDLTLSFYPIRNIVILQ